MSNDTTRRAEFCQSLRDFATFLEQHPDVPQPKHVMINFFPDDREALAAIARAASWTKDYTDSWFSLRREFGGDLVFDVTIERQAICRKVATGTRIVEAKPAVPEHTEETFEWVCDDAALLSR